MINTRLLLVLLAAETVAGCAPSYTYIPTSDSDPTIYFSEMFTQGTALNPFTPPFFAATWNPGETPACATIIRVGTNTKSIRVPAGKMVGVTGFRAAHGPGHSYSCSPPGRMFLAEPNVSYSVDIETTRIDKNTGTCRIAVVRKDSGHEIGLNEAPLLKCK